MKKYKRNCFAYQEKNNKSICQVFDNCFCVDCEFYQDKAEYEKRKVKVESKSTKKLINGEWVSI